MSSMDLSEASHFQMPKGGQCAIRDTLRLSIEKGFLGMRKPKGIVVFVNG